MERKKYRTNKGIRFKIETITAMQRSISRRSNRSPDFFDSTGSSGTSPETTKASKGVSSRGKWEEERGINARVLGGGETVGKESVLAQIMAAPSEGSASPRPVRRKTRKAVGFWERRGGEWKSRKKWEVQRRVLFFIIKRSSGPPGFYWPGF